MKTTSLPTDLLAREYQRARRSLLLWSLVCAVLALATMIASVLGWFQVGDLVASLLSVASFALLAGWLIRSARVAPEAVARELDERWALRARLESALELADNSSALAAAQRADAAEKLAGRKAPRTAQWLAGVSMLTIAAILVLAEVTFTAARALFALKPAEVTLKDKPQLPTDTTASITWKSPAPAIKATAIEEVPLAANVLSKTGLRTLTLEVMINGESKPSRSLDIAALSDVAQPGSHDIVGSLFLDEVGAHEYDIVAYHLRGERLGGTNAVVTSPLQFVQIRPLREDALLQEGQQQANASNSGPAQQSLAFLTALKTAQLQLMEQNFLLAHGGVDKTQPTWKTENERVAGEQTKLAGKATEARDFSISSQLPALMVDNLSRVVPLMQESGKFIASMANDKATRPQGAALALIAELEKMVVKMLSRNQNGGASASANRNDPFKDEQDYKLPPRDKTPAGKLEELAQRQQKANQQREADKSDPSKGSDASAAEQEAIAREAQQLLADAQLQASAQKALEDAAKAAAETAKQLKSGDMAAAREPSTAAQSAFDKAAAAQEKEGRTAAAAELDNLRRSLNEAARIDDPAEREKKLSELRDQLRDVALQQQNNGSAEAASLLSKLAKDMAAAKKKENPTKPTDSANEVDPAIDEHARELALAAARAQAALESRTVALDRSARQLNRAQQLLQDARDRGGVDNLDGPLADALLAAQNIEALTGDASLAERARKIAMQTERLRWTTSGGGRIVLLGELAEASGQLAAVLKAYTSANQRDELVRRFNPDEIDPAYRDAVQAYFERLSRGGAGH